MPPDELAATLRDVRVRFSACSCILSVRELQACKCTACECASDPYASPAQRMASADAVPTPVLPPSRFAQDAHEHPQHHDKADADERESIRYFDDGEPPQGDYASEHDGDRAAHGAATAAQDDGDEDEPHNLRWKIDLDDNLPFLTCHLRGGCVAGVCVRRQAGGRARTAEGLLCTAAGRSSAPRLPRGPSARRPLARRCRLSTSSSPCRCRRC
jgi:hypothetical protein